MVLESSNVCVCVLGSTTEFIYMNECFSLELAVASEKCMMELKIDISYKNCMDAVIDDEHP